MFSPLGISRRRFMKSASLMTAGIVVPSRWLPGTLAAASALQPLEQFDYGDVVLTSELHVVVGVIERPPVGAKRMDQRSWQLETAGATIKMLPFTDIGDEQYSTYLRVA